MRPGWQRINEWLDHRTGIQTAVRKFLYEEIPASSGWHQVFGSVAAFLFLSAFAHAAGPRLASIDLNPVFAMPEGQGAFAVDAVIEVGD